MGRTVPSQPGVYIAQSQLDDLIWAYPMNEATFSKLAEYSINDTLEISEASTFDLRCNFSSHATHLLFEIPGFSLFVRFFTRSHFCVQAE
jgi:hypothetical protein